MKPRLNSPSQLCFEARLAGTAGKNFWKERAGVFVLFAASPCPFALVKHLEHGRRQITASDTGVPVRFSSPSGPPGCISCVPLTWELSQMGACPVGPGCCPEQGGLLSLSGLSPGAPSPELIMHPHPATLTSRPRARHSSLTFSGWNRPVQHPRLSRSPPPLWKTTPRVV